MSTLKDVARHAGVAVSTVSAVINRSAPVSPTMEKKVRRALAELDYVPNSAARSLRSGSSRLIGVVLPDITNPHFAQSARVIEDRCLAAGYTVVIYNSNEETSRELKLLNALREQRIAGLVLNPTRSNREHGESLALSIRVPTVLMSSSVEGLSYPAVLFDGAQAAQMATDYLLRLGHRDIAVISGRNDVTAGRDRLDGCLAALKDRGLPASTITVLPGEFSREEAVRCTQAAMSQARPPTAILSLSAMMTFGMLAGLRSLGMKPGQDVSVIGIDDFDWSEILDPGITVIAQPIKAMAEAAMDLLFAEIEGKPVNAPSRFPPTLIQRGSCQKVELASGNV